MGPGQVWGVQPPQKDRMPKPERTNKGAFEKYPLCNASFSLGEGILCHWELASASIIIHMCVNNYLRMWPCFFCHLFFLFHFFCLYVPAIYTLSLQCCAFGVPLHPAPLECCCDAVISKTNLVPSRVSMTSLGICRLEHPIDRLPKSSKTSAKTLHGSEGAKKPFPHHKLG